MENFTKYKDTQILEHIETFKKCEEIILEKLKNDNEDYTQNMMKLQIVKDALNFLIDIIGNEPEMEYAFPIVPITTYEKFKSDLEVIKERKIYVPYIRDFLKNGFISFLDTDDFEKYIHINEPEDVKYTNKEILELTYDFYKTIPNAEMKKAFLKHYVERYKNFRITGIASNTMFLPIVNYSYINVADDITDSRKVINSIHEYGHVIDYELTKRFNSYADEYPFLELPSMFFEMLGTEYLSKIKPDSSELLSIEQLDRLFCMLTYSEVMMLEVDALSKTKMSTPLKFAYATKKYGKEEIGQIYSCDALQTFSYTYPYIVAIELLEQYRIDPEKTLDKLKTIMFSRDEEDFIKLLDKLEINPNENTTSYIQKIKTLTK